MNVTRYEVTIKPDGYYLNSKAVNANYSLVDTLIIDTWQMGLDLDPVDRMVITSILNGEGHIDELNRRYKKKIKDIMGQMVSFRIDSSCIDDINKAIVSCCFDLVSYVHSVHDSITFGNCNALPF